MAVPFLLIDGYNLMHAAGLARPTYGPGDLERCRHRLLRFLLNTLRPREIPRAKVVFDAFDAPSDLSRRYSFEGIEVLFAPPGSDADSVIEDLISRHSAPRQILVVSSDRRLQKAARRRRAQSSESGQFIDMLLRRTPRDSQSHLAPEANPKFEGTLSPGELDQWLQFFGDVKDVSLEELPPAPARTSTDEAVDSEPPSELESESEQDEWQQLFEDLGLADELAQEMKRDEQFLNLPDSWNDLDVDELGDERD